MSSDMAIGICVILVVGLVGGLYLHGVYNNTEGDKRKKLKKVGKKIVYGIVIVLAFILTGVIRALVKMI